MHSANSAPGGAHHIQARVRAWGDFCPGTERRLRKQTRQKSTFFQSEKLLGDSKEGLFAKGSLWSRPAGRETLCFLQRKAVASSTAAVRRSPFPFGEGWGRGTLAPLCKGGSRVAGGGLCGTLDFLQRKAVASSTAAVRRSPFPFGEGLESGTRASGGLRGGLFSEKSPPLRILPKRFF